MIRRDSISGPFSVESVTQIIVICLSEVYLKSACLVYYLPLEVFALLDKTLFIGNLTFCLDIIISLKMTNLTTESKFGS